MAEFLELMAWAWWAAVVTFVGIPALLAAMHVVLVWAPERLRRRRLRRSPWRTALRHGGVRRTA